MNPARLPTMPSDQPAPRPVALSQMKVGQRGRVQTAGLCCEDCELLNAMGLTDQCELRVCRAGRGSEPCIVQVNATRLGLCASLATRIMVAAE